MLDCIIQSPKIPAQASVIWLHGLGADGYDFADLPTQLSLPNNLGIRFIFPHAPLRSVTINGGMVMRAWYDILGLSADSSQDQSGLQQAQQAIQALIQREMDLGIPSNQIILGGFSQGGALALFSALQSPERLGGVISLSSYLPLADQLQKLIHPANTEISILQMHGTLDPVVLYEWGKFSYQWLHENNYPVEWHDFPIAHTICSEEIMKISAWMKRSLNHLFSPSPIA